MRPSTGRAGGRWPSPLAVDLERGRLRQQQGGDGVVHDGRPSLSGGVCGSDAGEGGHRHGGPSERGGGPCRARSELGTSDALQHGTGRGEVAVLTTAWLSEGGVCVSDAGEGGCPHWRSILSGGDCVSSQVGAGASTRTPTENIEIFRFAPGCCPFFSFEPGRQLASRNIPRQSSTACLRTRLWPVCGSSRRRRARTCVRASASRAWPCEGPCAAFSAAPTPLWCLRISSLANEGCGKRNETHLPPKFRRPIIVRFRQPARR